MIMERMRKLRIDCKKTISLSLLLFFVTATNCSNNVHYSEEEFWSLLQRHACADSMYLDNLQSCAEEDIYINACKKPACYKNVNETCGLSKIEKIKNGVCKKGLTCSKCLKRCTGCQKRVERTLETNEIITRLCLEPVLCPGDDLPEKKRNDPFHTLEYRF